MTGPAWFIRRAVALVSQIDRLGDPVMELALAELIDSGEIKRHYDKARQIYDQRRQSFGELLHRHLGPLARFSVPEGGLAFWVEFNFDSSLGRADFAARARTVGVRLLPSRIFWMGKLQVQATRIGYAHLTTAEAAEALRRLGNSLDLRH